MKKFKTESSIYLCYNLPPKVLYVASMCPMLFAGAVKSSPSAHITEPTKQTFLYEKVFITGPTKKPEKLTTESSVLAITDAPVVCTPRSSSKSLKRRPNDGSRERVENCK